MSVLTMINGHLSESQQADLRMLRKELLHWERQGVHSLTKMSYLIELMLNEGLSMSEIAGKTGTNQYNQLMQAVLDLGDGRAGQRTRTKPPQLVTTVPDQQNGRIRRVRITAKGRRLQQRLLHLLCR